MAIIIDRGRITLGIILALSAAGFVPNTLPAASDAAAPLAVVTSDERSRHFAAVASQLELGGTLFGYVDVDGDMLALAGAVQGIIGALGEALPMGAMLQQDYAGLFKQLGFDDIKAIGFSSVATTDGAFRNRTFLYMPEGRHGLLAGLGGGPAPFQHLRLAPADTDWYFETEADLPAVYAAVRGVITQVAGAEMADMVDAQLQGAGAEAGVSVYDLIQRAKGRLAGILQADDSKTIKLPGASGLTIPAFSFLLRLDGIAPGLVPLLDNVPIFDGAPEGGITIYTLAMPSPIAGWEPMLAVEGDALLVASSREFFDRCRSEKTGLAGNPVFAQALQELGSEGNGLTYFSPRFFAQIRRVPELNANEMAPQEQDFLRSMFLSQLPAVDFPLVATRVNRPDGILFRSRWYASLKQDIAVMSLYNPMTIGIMAAVAIPTVGKVRERSQDVVIQNNLRQLSMAAEQYYLENDVEEATYEDLVGPDKYIPELESVSGEDYSEIEFRQGEPLRVYLPDGREISF